MDENVYLNLAVKDLERSRSFFSGLGFSFNPQFSNQEGACLILGGSTFAMLLTEPFFKRFTSREICDTTSSVEVLIAISRDSREAVDDFMKKAIELGGREHRPVQDLGFMYSRSVEDLDGHVWEVGFMDLSKFPGAH